MAISGEAIRRVAEVKAKYSYPWWDDSDPIVVFLGQVQEPILIVEFDMFQEATEKALKRPVWTHEFAMPKLLLEEFQGKIPKATFDDVMTKLRAMVPDEKIIVVEDSQ